MRAFDTAVQSPTSSEAPRVSRLSQVCREKTQPALSWASGLHGAVDAGIHVFRLWVCNLRRCENLTMATGIWAFGPVAVREASTILVLSETGGEVTFEDANRLKFAQGSLLGDCQFYVHKTGHHSSPILSTHSRTLYHSAMPDENS